ncbi:hypothetical protein SK128_017219 [Halocaridina rubra]|uniref:Uncharacterized protein n=1 Tax=Halocaridina rubra TaxID=373956 RepID=A0AAN8X3W5_HALRR
MAMEFSRSLSENTIHVIHGDVPRLTNVHNYSSVDKFGWGFPEVAEGQKKKHVIDMKWLDEYNDDINNLQVAIKKERALSFGLRSEDLLERYKLTECHNRSEKGLGKERSESCCVQTHKEDHSKHPYLQSGRSEFDQSLCSAHSYEVDLSDRILDDSLISKENIESNSFQQITKQENVVIDKDEDSRPSTPFTEAFCSMQSFASRDSGISASDDISDTQPDFHGDCSLMEELEGACEFEHSETSTDEVSHTDPEDSEHEEPLGASDKLTKTVLDEAKPKRPVWYKRFSRGNIDVNFSPLSFGKHEYPGGLELDRSSKENSLDSISTGSDKELSIENPIYNTESTDSRRRQSFRQLWTTCNRLETLSLRTGSTMKGVNEITELVDTLSKLNSRLEILKYDLHSLTLQVKENHKELSTLEKKATELKESSAASRQHMTQLFCLEKLQERLQLEWWGLHYPQLVTLDENYMRAYYAHDSHARPNKAMGSNLYARNAKRDCKCMSFLWRDMSGEELSRESHS